jgi:type IV pilus assembly protein PilV
MKVFNLKNRPTGNQNGFTMIEILIAISIFAIGMLAVASMQISGIHGNARAQTLTGASTWASDQVETLLGMDYDDGNLVSGAAQEGRYQITWSVTTGTMLPNTKTIKVTVSDMNNKINDVTFYYYKADI